jgi:hypothetical protein
MDGFAFRLLVPTVDEIRPSSPLGLDLPGLPPAMDAETAAEYAAWRDALCDAANDCAADAFEAEAAAETRDDGALYHGRLPSEDVEGFNPYIIARAEVWPGPVDVIDGARLPAESWLGMRGGAA